MRAACIAPLVAALACGCATAPAAAPEPAQGTAAAEEPGSPDIVEVPVLPSDGADLVQPVERLAFEIYAHDIAAWRATDQAMESGFDLAAAGVTGWIAVPDKGHQFRVRFIGEGGSVPVSLLDVDLDVSSPRPGLVTERPGGAALEPIEQSMWRARQLAARSKFRTCSDRYNSVVLQAPNSDNWLVYLFAATPQRELVIGGHHRFLVSADGGEILESTALSSGCMTIPMDSESKVVVFTQSASDEPLETSVLLSLQVDKPIAFRVPDGSVWIATHGHLWRAREGPGK